MNITLFLCLLFLVLLSSIQAYRYHQSRLKKRWIKKLHLDEHQAIFLKITKDIDGFALSKQARLGHDAMEYTYGEITFVSFIALLSLTKPNSDTVFYDLGSGVGKAVLACTLVFDVKKSCGIELFENLHLAALKQCQHLKEILPNSKKDQKIHFILGNFLNTDFLDATLIFINATAFFGETWQALNGRLTQIKPGTIVITTSKKLVEKDFILQHTTLVAMSWGVVTAYIQQRKKRVISSESFM